jgi:hypothetical protein
MPQVALGHADRHAPVQGVGGMGVAQHMGRGLANPRPARRIGSGQGGAGFLEQRPDQLMEARRATFRVVTLSCAILR